MKQNGSALRAMWSNGGRSLLLAAIIFAAAIVIYVAATVAVFVLRPNPFAPLENITPQPVLNTGPIPQGGFVAVVAVKCNHSNRDVSAESRALFRNLDTSVLTLFRQGNASRAPGCTTIYYQNPVPLDLPPGRYQIEGLDIAREGTAMQFAPFRSDPFEVVAK